MLVSEVIDRDVVIEWPEAVAIVRAVLEQLQGARFPDLHQIEVVPSGDVITHGGSASTDPIASAGTLLQTLLNRTDSPVQLRLLNAQPHASIEDYSTALGFFERPNRNEVIQELYSRAASTAPPARRNSISEAAIGAFPSEIETTHEKRGERGRMGRRTMVLAACFCVTLVIVGAGAWFTLRSDAGGPPQDVEVESETAPKPGGVVSAISAAVSAIENKLGLRGAATVDAAPIEADGQTANGKTGETTTRSNVRALPTASRLPSTRRMTSPVPGRPLGLSSFLGERLPPVINPREDFTIVADTTVYSSESPGVVAAVGLRPQLPSITPGEDGHAREELSGIELLILPDGTVESVKLVGRPRDIHDSMLLSAAKAWQFSPATKDGVPVRYRKTVWIPRERWGTN